MKRLFLFFSAMLIVFAGKAQLFQQNFQSSTTPGSYVSLNPTIGQFNELFDGDAGTNMVIDINTVTGNNWLRFVRQGGSTGGYTRSTDFTKKPSVITFSFDIKVNGNLPNNTDNVATWYFGNGYNNGGTAPATTGGGNLTYAYFSLNFDDNFPAVDRARFHNAGATADGDYFNVNTTQQVYFIANNTGVPINYTAPDGTSESLGNDQYDLWVGNEISLNDINVSGPNEDITDMKFLFNGANGTIEMDNIIVNEITDFGAYFYQNFPTNVLSDYDATGTPNSGQFNQILDNGTGVTVSFPGTTGNYGLQFQRTVSTNEGGFLRSSNFSSSSPSTLMYEFDLTVSGISSNTTGGAGWYFGDGLPNDEDVPTLTGTSREVHSYFLINFSTANGGTYSFRNGEGAGTNSTSSFLTSEGTKRILFVINSNNSAINYTSPTGINESLSAESWDLWVGTTKVFDNQVVGGTGQDEPLNEIKFLWNAGGATMLMDNMLINPVPVANTTVDPQIINAQLNPQFAAKWTESSPLPYLTGYRLDVATDAGFTTFVPGFQSLYVDGSTTLEKLVTGVSLLNDHHIRVRPVYQIGSNEISGAWSNVTVLTSLEFLPVELTRFTASLVNKAAELKWATSEEFNSSHFEVERSSDGRSFTKIGSVTSKNSATGSSYAYTDQLLPAGKSYYRLKMVDLDGKFEYSHVVMVTNNEAVRMNAYPNPTRSTVTVQFSKAGAGSTIKVVSMEGRVMNQVAVPAGSIQMDINLNGMVPGIYHLIYTNNGEQSVKRIQKL